ncbi:class I SAM-dependent methyltransferase [bacterium]|nr:class I SAM-dependent methyltransferase [bacterium]
MFNYEIKTAYNTCSHLEKFLEASDVILDVGSGTGLVAEYIRKKTGAHVVCLDVVQDGHASEKPIVFDGEKMPFYDEAFDVSICCFVLHHVSFQKALLEEMKRVTKSKIIILEDVIENRGDHFLAFIHKLYSGFRYSSFYTQFRNNHGWRWLFSNCGLLIDKEWYVEKRREITYPISRRGYLLSKNGHL